MLALVASATLPEPEEEPAPRAVISVFVALEVELAPEPASEVKVAAGLAAPADVNSSNPAVIVTGIEYEKKSVMVSICVDTVPFS